MRRSGCRLALAAVLVGGSGCAGDGAGAPTDSRLVKGTGYEFEAPAGWLLHAGIAVGTGGVRSDSALSGPRRRGSQLSANVIRIPDAPPYSAKALASDAARGLARAREQQRDSGARVGGVAAPRHTTLDGEDAMALDWAGGHGGNLQRTRQLFVRRGSAVYVVTFGGPSGEYRAGLDDLEAIRTSWRWTD
jgi:hypothetical protein